MADRELLEAAAKAAGWAWWRSKHGYWNLTAPDGTHHTACHGWTKFDPRTGEELTDSTPGDALLEVGFCPLTDDGDALRLAVKLRLIVDPVATTLDGSEPAAAVMAPGSKHYIKENFGSDSLAATRRAIVRAAAEIQRQKESGDAAE